ncbi:MAG: 23S rRNA (adenine(2030)-N(6))-methyltransferase RlmJ [Alsobacter sp.]
MAAMNYRHAFHAGNFADVLKHAVLALVLRHLNRKDSAYRVIDTHAGIGLYDLGGDQANRTGEWRDGIGRLGEASFSAGAAERLAPYLDVVQAVRAEAGPGAYPGSPEIVRRMIRRQDRLVAVEKHPEDFALLSEALGRDRRAKAIALDGWTALRAYVPPVEKRGLVLVDPPFEEPGEFERMGRAVAAAWRKWPTGIYMLWYPVKQDADGDALERLLTGAGVAKRLRVELAVRPPGPESRLRGSGLLIVNPPWTLDADLRLLLPELGRVLVQDGRASWRCETPPDRPDDARSVD